MKLRRIMLCTDCGRRAVKRPLTYPIFRGTFMEGVKVWEHEDFVATDDLPHSYVGRVHPRFTGFELEKS